MKRIVLLGLLVAACEHPEPGVEIRTVEVVRTVPVQCVKRDAIPAVPARIGGKLTGDPVHDLDVVSASALRLRAVAEEAVALLQGCAG